MIYLKFFIFAENLLLMDKYIFFLLFLLPVSLWAQTPEADTLTITEEPRYDLLEELRTPGNNDGQARISADKNIDNLLQWHIHQNKKSKAFTGYRIQIYSVSSFGCNIEDLKEMRNKFELNFPDIPAYLKYFDPDFKIRVGNFHSRLECIPALYRIRKLYPSSYPVKTEISLEDLKRIPMQDVPEAELQE